MTINHNTLFVHHNSLIKLHIYVFHESGVTPSRTRWLTSHKCWATRFDEVVCPFSVHSLCDVIHDVESDLFFLPWLRVHPTDLSHDQGNQIRPTPSWDNPDTVEVPQTSSRPSPLFLFLSRDSENPIFWGGTYDNVHKGKSSLIKIYKNKVPNPWQVLGYCGSVPWRRF